MSGQLSWIQQFATSVSNEFFFFFFVRCQKIGEKNGNA